MIETKKVMHQLEEAIMTEATRIIDMKIMHKLEKATMIEARRIVAMKVMRQLEEATKIFIEDATGFESKNDILWFRTEIGKRKNLMEFRLTGWLSQYERIGSGWIRSSRMKENWRHMAIPYLSTVKGSWTFNARLSLYISYETILSEQID